MIAINERIRQVRTALNLTQQEFAEQILIAQSSLGEIETRGRKVNKRVVQIICSQFSVNEDWLKNGNGEMFGDEVPDIRKEHLIKIYNQLTKPLQDCLIEHSESLLKVHNANTITNKKEQSKKRKK